MIVVPVRLGDDVITLLIRIRQLREVDAGDRRLVGEARWPGARGRGGKGRLKQRRARDFRPACVGSGNVVFANGQPDTWAMRGLDDTLLLTSFVNPYLFGSIECVAQRLPTCLEFLCSVHEFETCGVQIGTLWRLIYSALLPKFVSIQKYRLYLLNYFLT